MINYKQEIDIFLKKKSKKKKIIVIYWPTWSGKTNLSIEVAKYLNTEIISTDSRQIFKYMNIWTGKITKEEKKWINHHMIDIVNPNEEFSAWEFKNIAEKIILKIQNNWKIPMLVWWTGLYIDSLVYDFNIPKIPWDKKLREELEQEAEKKWKEHVFNKLKDLDPDYDKYLHVNNLRYVIRALEVKILTWKSKTSFKQEKKLKYDVLFLTPYNWDREELYSKINNRVKKMFNSWLIEEIKWLFNKWYKESDFWMNSIWYMEVYSYLDWEILLDDAIQKVQQNSRNSAKRQLTWFKKYTK